jgi:signal transduction histidine kinase
MEYESRAARGWLYPVAVWSMLLAGMFAVEYAVMLILPLVLKADSPRALEAALDSVLLTLVLAPALWWTIVRPLTEVIRLRTQFLSELFQHIEEDRRQTAHELHDGVGQSLTLLISGLRSAKICRATVGCSNRVSEFQRLAEEALAEVRRLSLGLRPSLLDDLGLAPALERLVEDVKTHHAIDISLDSTQLGGQRLPDDTATIIFRIVQEALSNIITHSQAKHATIRAESSAAHVFIQVSDDGCGIAPEVVRCPPPGHLGLRGMRERANLAAGTFTLESRPAQGTRISVTIPLIGKPDGQDAIDARRRPQGVAVGAADTD